MKTSDGVRKNKEIIGSSSRKSECIKKDEKILVLVKTEKDKKVSNCKFNY